MAKKKQYTEAEKKVVREEVEKLLGGDQKGLIVLTLDIDEKHRTIIGVSTGDSFDALAILEHVLDNFPQALKLLTLKKLYDRILDGKPAKAKKKK